VSEERRLLYAAMTRSTEFYFLHGPIDEQGPRLELEIRIQGELHKRLQSPGHVEDTGEAGGYFNGCRRQHG
jgi:hypothetical protein